MVRAMEVERERLRGIGLIFAIRQVSCLSHLREHHVATLRASVRVTHGVKERRVLAQTDKRCRFANRQVARFLIKIGVGCRFYAHSVMKEIEIVEIERNNLLLCVVAFKLHGYDPFYRLLQQTLHGARCRARIELFSQLLRDG